MRHVLTALVLAASLAFAGCVTVHVAHPDAKDAKSDTAQAKAN